MIVVLCCLGSLAQKQARPDNRSGKRRRIAATQTESPGIGATSPATPESGQIARTQKAIVGVVSAGAAAKGFRRESQLIVAHHVLKVSAIIRYRARVFLVAGSVIVEISVRRLYAVACGFVTVHPLKDVSEKVLDTVTLYAPSRRGVAVIHTVGVRRSGLCRCAAAGISLPECRLTVKAFIPYKVKDLQRRELIKIELLVSVAISVRCSAKRAYRLAARRPLVL